MNWVYGVRFKRAFWSGMDYCFRLYKNVNTIVTSASGLYNLFPAYCCGGYFFVLNQNLQN